MRTGRAEFGKSAHTRFLPARTSRSKGKRRKRNARRGKDRIAQGRRCGRRAGFADAARRLAALDQMDVDRRRLVDPQHAVIVEIALLHAALVNGDLAIERGRRAEDQPALQLRDDGVGIDGDAGVDRAGDAMHVDIAVIDRLPLRRWSR